MILSANEQELSRILEEVTEIATKTRMNADFVPGTVSVITGKELKALGISNLAQSNAFDAIVGFDTLSMSMRGGGSVYGGQGNKIKWMINGNVVNSQLWGGSMYGKNAIAFPVSVEQIDRIEIIRGPDSAIYGDNAIFGVVNIITKSVENDAFASFGSNEGGRYSKSGGANIHVDINDIHLRANLYLFQDDGYPLYVSETNNFYNETTGTFTPGYGPGYLPNRTKGYSLFTAASKNDLEFWVDRMETKMSQGALGTWYPTQQFPKYDNGYGITESYTKFGVLNRFYLSGVSIVPKIGYDVYEQNIRDFLRVSSLYITPATSQDGVRNRDYAENKKYAQLDIEKSFDNNRISAGVFYQKTTVDKYYREENFSYTGNWLAGEYKWAITPFVGSDSAIPTNTKREQKAFYAQNVWDTTDDITVTAGARYDRFTDDIDNSAISPRLAVVYRLSDNHILKAQYARAFRPPSFAEMSAAPSTIKPETVDTFELGYIYRGNSNTFKTTVFGSQIKDMITANDITYETQNSSKTGDIYGVEIEYKYTSNLFNAGFNQAIYHTHVDGMTYTPATNSQRFVFDGGSFPLAASYMTNIFLTLNPNENYPTTLWYHYAGSKKRKAVYTPLDNNTFYVALGRDNGSVEAQDYLNITQQIKNIAKNTDLLIGIQNVFDKTQNNLYMPLNPRNRQDIPVSGRSFWMSLSYKF